MGSSWLRDRTCLLHCQADYWATREDPRQNILISVESSVRQPCAVGNCNKLEDDMNFYISKSAWFILNLWHWFYSQYSWSSFVLAYFVIYPWFLGRETKLTSLDQNSSVLQERTQEGTGCFSLVLWLSSLSLNRGVAWQLTKVSFLFGEYNSIFSCF